MNDRLLAGDGKTDLNGCKWVEAELQNLQIRDGKQAISKTVAPGQTT